MRQLLNLSIASGFLVYPLMLQLRIDYLPYIDVKDKQVAFQSIYSESEIDVSKEGDTRFELSERHGDNSRFKKHIANRKNYLTTSTQSTTSALDRQETMPWVQVQRWDFIYDTLEWDQAPVVVESHKLIFFTTAKVGCTVWKMLLKRMMGHDDWKMGHLPNNEKIHNPKKNRLTYLSHYNLTKATQMMNDPSYTRAIFVRDPKERLLSAYLDKVFDREGIQIKRHCCKDETNKTACWERFKPFSGFVDLAQHCPDNHWRPQSQRMERKYLHLLNFVGHLETAAEDAKRLLERIGAWEQYGASGWGANGDQSIFASKSDVGHVTANSSSISQSRMTRYYTSEIEQKVERWFSDDYKIPSFNLSK